MKSRLMSVSLAAILLVAGLSGCAGPGSADGGELTLESLQARAEGDGGERQVAMLEDGKLSTSELESSIDAMFECFSDKSIWYEYEGVNPIDGWRPLYGVNMDDPGAVDACELNNFRYVSLGWEMLNEETMDPELMSVIQSCLAERGEEVTGTEKNLSDLAPAGASDEARITQIRSCATAVGERFPSMIFAYK